MKYADIDIKTARKCCKAHSTKNKKGQTIIKCETCPLERKGKFCYYMLKSLHEPYANDKCPIIKVEYNALMEEDIEKQQEWEEWLKTLESEF